MSVLFNKKDSSTLYRLRYQLAADGCLESQISLGKCFLKDDFKTEDESEAELAVYWLLKATTQGSEEAKELLKVCYKTCKGITLRNKSAVEAVLKESETDRTVTNIFNALLIQDKLSDHQSENDTGGPNKQSEFVLLDKIKSSIKCCLFGTCPKLQIIELQSSEPVKYKFKEENVKDSVYFIDRLLLAAYISSILVFCLLLLFPSYRYTSILQGYTLQTVVLFLSLFGLIKCTLNVEQCYRNFKNFSLWADLIENNSAQNLKIIPTEMNFNANTLFLLLNLALVVSTLPALQKQLTIVCGDIIVIAILMSFRLCYSLDNEKSKALRLLCLVILTVVLYCNYLIPSFNMFYNKHATIVSLLMLGLCLYTCVALLYFKAQLRVVLHFVICLAWLNLARTVFVNFKVTHLEYKLVVWVIVLAMLYYLRDKKTHFIVALPFIVIGNLYTDYSMFIMLFSVLFLICYVAIDYFNISSNFVLIFILLMVPLMYPTPVNSILPKGPVMQWETYYQNCVKQFWGTSRDLNNELHCNQLEGIPISFEGTLSSVKVIKTSNRVYDALRLLPVGIMSRLICFLGETCENEDWKCPFKCHLQYWNINTVTIQIGPYAGTEINLWTDNCRNLVEVIKPYDIVRGIATLRYPLVVGVTNLDLATIECTNCQHSTSCSLLSPSKWSWIESSAILLSYFNFSCTQMI